MKITKSTLKRIIKEEILKEMMGNNRFAQIRQALADSNPIPDNLKPLNPMELEYVEAYFEKEIPNDRFKKIKRIVSDPKESFFIGSHITRDELLYILNLGALKKCNFSKASFSGADLSGLDLGELVIPILHADLSGANLKNTNLEGVTFFQVNLEGANLEGANLSKSLLTYSNLSDANLTGANLTGAEGRDVSLKNTNFTNAILFDISIDANEEDLDGIILKGAKYDDETFLVGYDPFRAGEITIADSIVRDPKYGAIKVDNSTSDGDQ